MSNPQQLAALLSQQVTVPISQKITDEINTLRTKINSLDINVNALTTSLAELTAKVDAIPQQLSIVSAEKGVKGVKKAKPTSDGKALLGYVLKKLEENPHHLDSYLKQDELSKIQEYQLSLEYLQKPAALQPSLLAKHIFYTYFIDKSHKVKYNEIMETARRDLES
jgi:hypothetical protein